jgi:hypothetical protein
MVKMILRVAFRFVIEKATDSETPVKDVILDNNRAPKLATFAMELPNARQGNKRDALLIEPVFKRTTVKLTEKRLLGREEKRERVTEFILCVS